MQDGTMARVTPPAVVGLAANVACFGLYQYHRISVDYVPTAVAFVIMGLITLTGLTSIASWAVAARHYAEGRGQSPYWALLAILAPIIGPFTLAPLYLMRDLTARRRGRHAHSEYR